MMKSNEILKFEPLNADTYNLTGLKVNELDPRDIGYSILRAASLWSCRNFGKDIKNISIFRMYKKNGCFFSDVKITIQQ